MIYMTDMSSSPIRKEFKQTKLSISLSYFLIPYFFISYSLFLISYSLFLISLTPPPAPLIALMALVVLQFEISKEKLKILSMAGFDLHMRQREVCG